MTDWIDQAAVRVPIKVTEELQQWLETWPGYISRDPEMPFVPAASVIVSEFVVSIMLDEFCVWDFDTDEFPPTRDACIQKYSRYIQSLADGCNMAMKGIGL